MAYDYIFSGMVKRTAGSLGAVRKDGKILGRTGFGWIHELFA
jgi:hypothetical protein